MPDPIPPQRLRLLPFQVIQDAEGLILRRGVEQLLLRGGEAADILQTLSRAMGNGGATADEVASLFAEPDRPRILELLGYLARRRFVAPVNGEAPRAAESNLDVLYWQFHQEPAATERRMADLRVALVGVNHLTRRIAGSLAAVGVKRMEVIDDPLLRSEAFFGGPGGEAPAEAWPAALPAPREARGWTDALPGGKPHVLVAASDFGGQPLLLPWNQLAVEHGMHFLPVTLQDLIGYVGPLVIPGETACLACLRARQNANLVNPGERRMAEAHAHAGQRVAATHPSMLAVVAEVAAFELHRFYAPLPQWKVGHLLEVNLLGSAVARRRVFKAPRCPVCSPLHDGVPVNQRKMVPLSAILNR